MLIEFGSVVGAVECSLALQKIAAERNVVIAGDRRMEWRIGIHIGEVLVEGNDILGDGVNIAARLEGLAEPGGVCIRKTPSARCAARSGPSMPISASRALRTSQNRCASVAFASPSPPLPQCGRSAGDGAERQRREA